MERWYLDMYEMTRRWFPAVSVFAFLSMSAAVSAADLVNPDHYRSLTADKRAFRPGDTITVLIAEQTSAESRANTGRDRNVALTGSATDSTSEHDISLNLDSSSQGTAVTRRLGTLRGQITATVLAVDDVGHLVVEGQQILVINGEEQSIKVRGTLRPEDIDRNNTVLSSRLTNSKIEFTGQGIVSEAQRPGLISAILRFLRLN